MSSPAPRPEPLSEWDARFDRLVERWFRRRLELSPETATNLGIHDRDGELGAASRDAVDEELDFVRATTREVDGVPAGELTPDRGLDRELLLHDGRLRELELAHCRTWAGRSGAAEAIGDALFPLFTRDFAPLPERLESIRSRLDAVPRYLTEARGRVVDPVPLWIELDLESIAALPRFLDTILAAAGAEQLGDGLVPRLERAVTSAKAALDEHAAWLRADVLPRATRPWHTGPELFDELIGLRELDAGSDEILAVGEQMLADAHAARDAIAGEIDPLLSPAEVADAVKNDHPATFAEALDGYRESMERARRFIVEHDLMTMPPSDRLIVIETPPYIRHLIPLAAYDPPAKFDADPIGTYIVTPPATPGMMREHNHASISNTSVHEAYPGHHLQLSAAISNASLVRLLSFAPEFEEGWAFYCEQLMKEHGFDDTPRHRYAQLTDVIWRATRIVLDVRLHRGEVGFEEGVERLMTETGFERPAALAEVKRYTSTPGYQLSYLFGRHLIDRLKADVQARMGPAFGLKYFHDTLLYAGSIPVSYARRLFERRLAPDRAAG
ncbi:MAG: DUF885 domain-containing protein [Chloroflexota bacterium]|nr:DUF885 domain-containing protein [Chloroflexota bacterium]